MQINEITLLTSEEYKRTKHLISDSKCTWWLQDEGKYGEPYSVSFLDAKVTDAPPRGSERYVRPAMRVTGIDHKPGTKITAFAYVWTVLETEGEESLILCEDVVTLRPFDKHGKAYAESDIKKWLEGWLAKRQKTTDTKKHKRYKCMNQVGVYYLATPFLREWLTHILLVLPMAAAMLQCVWNINDVVAVPGILHTIMWYGYATIAFLFSFTTLFVLGSPHKDTGLRHLLNVVGFWTVLVWCNNACSLVALTAMTFAFLIATVNYRYLQSIKYYS